MARPDFDPNADNTSEPPTGLSETWNPAGVAIPEPPMDDLSVRVAALNAAVAQVHLPNSYESAVKVVAFAEHFEHYLRTGENKDA